MQKICDECGEVYESNRSDSRFCKDTCRVKNHKKRTEQQVHQNEVKAEQQRLEDNLAQQIEQLNKTIDEHRAKIRELTNLKLSIPGKIYELQKRIEPIENRIAENEALLAMRDMDFYNQRLNKEYLDRVKNGKAFPEHKLVKEWEEWKQRKEIQEVKTAKFFIRTAIAMSRNEKATLENEIEAWKLKQREISPAIDREMDMIRVLNKRLMRLDELRYEKPKEPVPQIQQVQQHQQVRPQQNGHTPFIPQQLRPQQPDMNRKKPKGDIGAEDLMNMVFNTFTLPGELGRFLGELDRNMTSFALTGDSGAGKSFFSYEIVKLFLDNGFTAKYFSLEEGIGALTQKKIERYDIGNELRFHPDASASLKEVRTAAQEFDLVVVDSFQKLDADPEDFEKLRKDFPHTIFIIIFQKTTAGTMRGGSSIKFNSSATINVTIRDEERIAVMEKGRYGTQGWEYSTTQRMIVKDNESE